MARLFGAEKKVPAGPRAPGYGPDNFVLGANLPWVGYGGDFGANAWQPDGGISRPGQRLKLDETFARLASDGATHVRWFMFADGRAGIRFDPDGTPVGLDSYVFQDVDAALESARKHGIKLTFVLVDFLFLKKAEVHGEVQTGGHADVVRDPAKRSAFVRNVLVPLFDRYGKDPAIEAWDVINEPEWATFGLGTADPRHSVAPAEMRAFIREVASAVHGHTEQMVTVGSAGTAWLDQYQGLGLDFYQAHWYDHHDWRSPLTRPVEKLRLDRPLVLGEFPTRGSRKSTWQILDEARQAGYGGAMPWAVLSDDTATSYEAASSQVAGWARKHANSLYKGRAAAND